MTENSPSLDEVIAAARDEARAAGQATHGVGDESDEYAALMSRLREASRPRKLRHWNRRCCSHTPAHI